MHGGGLLCRHKNSNKFHILHDKIGFENKELQKLFFCRILLNISFVHVYTIVRIYKIKISIKSEIFFSNFFFRSEAARFGNPTVGFAVYYLCIHAVVRWYSRFIPLLRWGKKHFYSFFLSLNKRNNGLRVVCCSTGSHTIISNNLPTPHHEFNTLNI